MTVTNELAPSRALAAKLLKATLGILQEHPDGLSRSDVMSTLEKTVELDEWARERYEKTGYVRWHAVLQMHSILLVKAGFLIKKKGRWYVTPEGTDAIKLGDVGLLMEARRLYKAWDKKAKNDVDESASSGDDSDPGDVDQSAMTLDQVEQLAADGIKDYIKAKNPYEFQDLVAALMRGMGYYTPFVAPKGKDGGVDIVAYRDPFGIESPRIKLQVKHRGQSASVMEIRQLMGVLQRDTEVGIFVSTGGYTSDAKAAVLSSHPHVQLIDLDEFITLWQEFYKKMADEDRNLLPLLPVYFVAPTE